MRLLRCSAALVLGLCFLCFAGDTLYVAGSVSGRWRGIVLVVSNVTIANGDTLIIEPGTTVLMKTPKAGISVQGVLFADGTRLQSIQFRSTARDFFWDRLAFSGNHASELTHCHIHNCRYGIYLQDAWVNMQYCTFNRCLHYAIYAQRGRITAYRSIIRTTLSNATFTKNTDMFYEECKIVQLGKEDSSLRSNAGLSWDFWRLRPGLALGVHVQSFEEEEETLGVGDSVPSVHAYKYEQMSFPVTVYVPVTNAFNILASTYFANSINVISPEYPGQKDPISIQGLTDVRAQVMLTALKKRLSLMMGGNSPTGVRKVGIQKSSLVYALGDEDMLFRVRQYGEGPGLNVSAAFANKITGFGRWAIGGGYFYRGSYYPFSSDTTQAALKKPGNIGTFTAGLDMVLPKSLLRLDMKANLYGKEYADSRAVLRRGPVLYSKVGYRFKLGPSLCMLSIYDLVRTRNWHEVEQDTNVFVFERDSLARYGNRIGLAVENSFLAGKRWEFALGTEARFDAKSPQTGYRKALLIGHGGATYLLSSKLKLKLAGKLHKGSEGKKYALFGGREIWGYEGSAGIRYGF